MPAPPPLRCSDADRDKVIEQLQVHYVDGRLQLDEYQERAERALCATYLHQLPVLLADLPPVPPSRLAKPNARQHRHFCGHRLLLTSALGLVVTALFAGALAAPDPEEAWLTATTLLMYPLAAVFALTLGLPCPQHAGGREPVNE